jgi:hypothetical protein
MINGIDDEKIPSWVYGLVLVLICFVTRLPQLLSPNLLLDGDECILGLMAKHIADGKEIPVFFSGQNYGFSLIENIFGAIGFKLFGIGAITLRVSLLCIWCIGIIFFFRTFEFVSGKSNAFMITILIILIPAWALGAMKARGGYITAFTLTFIFTSMDIRLNNNIKFFTSLIIGLLVGLIYLSRPFWIPGLIPFIFYSFIYKRNFKQLAVLVSMAIVVVFYINKLFIMPSNEYWKPALFTNFNYFAMIKEIPSRIYDNITGSYWLDHNIKLGIFTRISTLIWSNMIIVATILQIYRIIKKQYNPLSHICYASMILTLAYTPLLNQNYGARYLLPYSCFLVMWAGSEILDNIEKKTRYAFVIPIIGVALFISTIGSMIEYKNFNFMPPMTENNKSEKERIDDLLIYLQKNNVNNVFSANPMFQWEIMFYSKEEIIARWFNDTDRNPIYPKMVDKAFEENKPTAIVGYKNEMLGLDKNPSTKEQVVYLSDRYFAYLNPTKDLLKSLGYSFQ